MGVWHTSRFFTNWSIKHSRCNYWFFIFLKTMSRKVLGSILLAVYIVFWLIFSVFFSIMSD